MTRSSLKESHRSSERMRNRTLMPIAYVVYNIYESSYDRGSRVIRVFGFV